MLIITSIIFPLETTGESWTPDPVWTYASGNLVKFTTSEEPYPTPFEDRLVDTIDPLTIGWMIASNVSDPTEEIPTSPMIWTETSV